MIKVYNDLAYPNSNTDRTTKRCTLTIGEAYAEFLYDDSTPPILAATLLRDAADALLKAVKHGR